jgi:hypothetical protein
MMTLEFPNQMRLGPQNKHMVVLSTLFDPSNWYFVNVPGSHVGSPSHKLIFGMIWKKIHRCMIIIVTKIMQ